MEWEIYFQIGHGRQRHLVTDASDTWHHTGDADLQDSQKLFVELKTDAPDGPCYLCQFWWTCEEKDNRNLYDTVRTLHTTRSTLNTAGR